MLRLSAVSLVVLLLASPAFAQEEEVYANIENIQGDADGFFELFSILQDAVMFGDPTTIADYALYPLTVSDADGSYEAADKTELLSDFDGWIAPTTQQALLETDVDDLIVTSDGVGVGNGAIWLANACIDDACNKTHWVILSINN